MAGHQRCIHSISSAGEERITLFQLKFFSPTKTYSVCKLTATECCFLTSWKWDGSPPGRWLCHICAFSGRPGLERPSSDPPLHQPTGTADLESAWWWGSKRCRSAISPLSSEELDGWENNAVKYSPPWCTPDYSGAASNPKSDFGKSFLKGPCLGCKRSAM